MPGTGEFGQKMNSMPKYVVSSTLDKVEWAGSKLITGNLFDEIRKLKQQAGRDLLLSGSAQLFSALARENLIDLYRFMLHPIILGSGKRLFADGTDQRVLTLTESKAFAGGIVVLEYVPANND
jgi:dihydrofolate reductase